MCICRLRVPSVDHVIDYSSDDNMSTLFSIQTVNAFDTRNAIADTLYIYIYTVENSVRGYHGLPSTIRLSHEESKKHRQLAPLFSAFVTRRNITFQPRCSHTLTD